MAVEKQQDAEENDESDNTVEAADSDNTSDAVSEKKAGQTDDKEAQEPVRQSVSITITVNGQPVVLSGKPDYIVVDLFQFYSFDLTTVRGNLVFLHNGSSADYSSPLNDGDVIELRWEDK